MNSRKTLSLLPTTFNNFDNFVSQLERQFVGNDFFQDFGLTLRNDGYPHYNIAQLSENQFVIELAVAGFTLDELKVKLEGNILSIAGDKTEQVESSDDSVVTKSYLYKGISERKFTRQFTLGKHIEVSNVTLEDGIMAISLFRNEPESEKAKFLPITKKS